MDVRSRYISVGGIRTHYLEAGEGPVVVLLHSGEFGGCAELSWEFNIGPLSRHFRVIAPDFLGFGRTDKLRDFISHSARMIEHMAQFLRAMCIESADFVGNSMSGRLLCRVASMDHPVWPIRRMVVASGAGFEPDNEERRILQNYDCTRESMKKVLEVLFYDRRWANDEAYLERRYQLSLLPGAWEVAAAARFRSPAAPPRPQFGRPDKIEYEKIKVPVLFVAGKEDRLLPPGYTKELVQRTPYAEELVIDECAHCPNIEKPDVFNAAVIEFFTKPIETAGR